MPIHNEREQNVNPKEPKPLNQESYCLATADFNILSVDNRNFHLYALSISVCNSQYRINHIFQNTILFCEAKKDENIRHFSRDLDTLIFKIRTRLMDIMNRVRDPDLLSTDMPAVAALSKLDQLNEEVQQLSGKARSYASYQERFGSSLSQSKKNMFGEYVF